MRKALSAIAMLALAIGIVVVDRLMPERDRLFETESISELEKTAPAESSELAARKFVGPPVVAVLPFKAAGSDDGGFLAGGLHDDLLTRLAKLNAFKVISRTSMMEYADTTKNMRQIGEELGLMGLTLVVLDSLLTGPSSLNLFGGGYGAQAEHMMQRLLAEC